MNKKVSVTTIFIMFAIFFTYESYALNLIGGNIFLTDEKKSKEKNADVLENDKSHKDKKKSKKKKHRKSKKKVKTN